jgi:hypothetical protein
MKAMKLEEVQLNIVKKKKEEEEDIMVMMMMMMMINNNKKFQRAGYGIKVTLSATGDF